MVVPGRVIPSCGPITWTIPWSGLSIPNSLMPNLRQFDSSVLIWMDDVWSRIGRPRLPVGMLWVDGGHGQVGAAYAASGRAEPVKGLGRGDLVYQVAIYVQQRGAAPPLHHHVRVPDLVEQRAGHSPTYPGTYRKSPPASMISRIIPGNGLMG